MTSGKRTLTLGKIFVQGLQRLGVLSRLNIAVGRRYGDTRVAIPLEGNRGACHFGLTDHETWVASLARVALLITPGAFIDVGVNLGQTILTLLGAGLRPPYVGFEPNPMCVAYVDRLLRRNAISWVRLVPAALSDECRVLELQGNSETDSASSIIASFRDAAYKMSQYAVAVSGDQAITAMDVGRISMIKVDVEGAELGVVKGMRQTIIRDKPCILCEILPIYDPATENGAFRLRRAQELNNILKVMGYDLYSVNHHGPSLHSEPDIPIHSDLDRSDYMFLPTETAAGFLSHINSGDGTCSTPRNSSATSSWK